MQDMQSLIDKINALRNKGLSSDYEGESEAFLAKAMELMSRHNIEESQLHGLDKSEIGKDKFILRGFGNASYGVARLYWDVAPIVGCSSLCDVMDRYQYDTKKNERTVVVWLFGTESDREKVRWLIDTLLIPQMLADVVSDRPRSRKSYCAAWSMRVAKRLRDAQSNIYSEYGALIPTNSRAHKEAMKYAGKGKSTEIDAYDAALGSSAANNANIGQDQITRIRPQLER